MTDPNVTVKPGFWGELFTAPRIASFSIMFALAAFTMGTYVTGLKNDVQSLRDRIYAIEVALPRDYQRKDTIEKDLAAIRETQREQREAQQQMVDALVKLRQDLR